MSRLNLPPAGSGFGPSLLQNVLDELTRWSRGGVGAENLALEHHYLQPNASPTVTTTMADFGSNAMTLAKAGDYIVLCTYDFNLTVAGVGVCIGDLSISGADRGIQALTDGGGGVFRGTVNQVHLITVAAGATLKLRVRKTINAGTLAALNTHSSIIALQVA